MVKPSSDGAPQPARPAELADQIASRLLDRYGAELTSGTRFEALGADEVRASAPRVTTRYVVGPEVARGGMGAILRVWDRDIDRPLAMKVILGRRGLERDSAKYAQLVRRFLREAKVTGQLDHPGVVPIHDLGIDSEGQAFFTMRLVKGRDLKEILELVRSRRPGWGRRRVLEILLKVCDTIAYAHSRGVIHRDLKPSNIRVGDFGEVYVMDWGLARVTLDNIEEEIAESHREFALEDYEGGADETQEGAILGTPAFMAPEQARGEMESVGPAADVYSVGAVLYTLLTGEIPYVGRGEEPSASKILVRVRTGPPEPIGDVDPTVPSGLARICERAMARELDERYPSTREMAEELRAYLEAEELSARAAERAREEAHAARQVADFLTELFTVSTPSAAKAEQITVLEILGRGAERIREDLADQPRMQASLQETLAQIYDSLGLYKEALPLLEAALETRREQPGADKELTRTYYNLASVQSAIGEYESAEPLYREALARRRELYGEVSPEVAETLSSLAALHMDRGRYDDAEPLFREALEQHRTLFGDQHSFVATDLNDLGLLLRNTGRKEEAESLYRESLAMRRRLLGDEHPHIATSLNNLGVLLMDRGATEEAEPLLREALELRTHLLGDDHPHVAVSLNTLAVLLYRRGRHAEVEELLRSALEIRRNHLGDDHPQVANTLYNLASVLRDQEEYEKAEPLIHEALEMYRRLLGDDHSQVTKARWGLATLLHRTERGEQAEQIYREVLVGYRRDPESVAPTFAADLLLWFGRLLSESDRIAEAEALLRECLALLRETLPAEHPRIIEASAALGRCAEQR